MRHAGAGLLRARLAPGPRVSRPAATRAAQMGTQAEPRRVAVAQMTSTADVDANIATCSRLAEAARARGCSMLFLPECCAFIGSSQAETVAAGEPLAGPRMRRLQDLARATGLWLSLGGFQETGPNPGRIFNTHVILDATGAVRARYRKVHLFDVDVEGGPILMESNSTAPGDEAVSCESPCGRLGVTTCYDVRFPALYQALRFQHGASVLLVPSAFTRATGAAHWDILLRARAIETQCYVIAAAQAGEHNAKRQSYGHACIIDPWGTVVAKLEDPSATGIAVAELDGALLESVRTRMPLAAHRERGMRQLGWSELPLGLGGAVG